MGENMNSTDESLSASIIANAQEKEPVLPHHVASNILEFLKRVQTTGMEAVAWVEAFNHVQNLVPKQPGVPFNGLPQR